MDRKDMLTDLLMMAAADGSIGEDELRMLAQRAEKLGISEAEFDQAQKQATNESTKLVIPEEKADRIALLRDLLQVMIADENLSVNENRFFSKAAAAMSISDTELKEILEAGIDQHQQDQSADPRNADTGDATFDIEE